MQKKNTLTVASDRSLYVGAIPATGWHVHAAVVFLLGLSGRFALHFPDGSTEYCQSALVDLGVEHLFDPLGEDVALVYLEPDSPEARGLRLHFQQQGSVIFDPAYQPRLQSNTNRYLHAFDMQSLLTLPSLSAAPLDQRVARALYCLRQPAANAWNRGALADLAHLSASRFNHVFKQEMGVSFRSYRVWSQMRTALGAMGLNPSLTHAALEGGFVDSSHFSRTFRNTFGMTPSSVLKPLKWVKFVGA